MCSFYPLYINPLILLKNIIEHAIYPGSNLFYLFNNTLKEDPILGRRWAGRVTSQRLIKILLLNLFYLYCSYSKFCARSGSAKCYLRLKINFRITANLASFP